MLTHFSRQSIALLWLLIVILALSGCSGSPAAATPTPAATQAAAADPYWPTAAWRSSTPEAQGMDSQRLKQMLAAIQQQGLNLYSLLVIRNGYLVSENYFGSFKQESTFALYSCTKSFVSTLVGIALDKGKITSTNQPILDFFPGRTFANPGPLKEAMTLDDVLTMRTGLDWKEGDPAYRALSSSTDWAQFMLDKPVLLPPGIKFNYCSGCSHLLTAAVQQATGMKTFDFADQNLFKPLGISNVSWEADNSGISVGGWGLRLTARDMAKLGYLFLRDGQWDGKQIVSARWVEEATRNHTYTDGNLGYGYQWWTYPSLGGYVATGLYGQTIFVIPASDLVIVTTAQIEGHSPIFRLIEQYIVPAVQK